MAVTDVKRFWSGGGAVDERLQRRYTVKYRAQTDSSIDGPFTVLTDSRLPLIGDPYFDQNGRADVGARCILKTPEQEGDEATQWIVTCEYSTKTRDPIEQKENPLLRPPDIFWDTAKFTKTKIKATFAGVGGDQDNVAIMNSSEEPFDPVEVDDSRRVLVIERNELTFDSDLADTYQDVINAFVFARRPPKTAKVSSITARHQFENGIGYWRVIYTIEFRREGWDQEYRDEGYSEIDTVAKTRTLILDSTSTPVSKPVPLNGAGKKLDPGAAPVFRKYRLYTMVNFADLRLPVIP
mgnify:CR=1 FL=1